ncbi:hypothetical protein [Spirosoma agri]|uniref:TonB-dependent receptor plug domain-containing protein n=1 Tax=Spirosoma agri TaxID=1987381 RepID=A0A6M0IFZ6_9BACT|nr:hypothetical protein [Spirosoma agri]NEU66675.1 hypothetical protein [Spirosoma agri]
MKLRHIIPVALTACSFLHLTACHKAGWEITTPRPLEIVINEKPHHTIKPLILVDGTEIENVTKGTLNPDDIESVSVLQSNSANNLVDMYGPKAKDGVILVSTKAKR